jgi:signal transduction histidine kinase
MVGRRGGVRLRTTLAATVIVGAALVVGGSSLVLLLERSQTSALQAAVTARATDIAGLSNAGRLPHPISARADDSSLVQVVAADGTVVTASENIVGEPRLTDFVPSGTGPDVRTIRRLPIGEGASAFRVVALRSASPEGPRIVYVAASLGGVQENVRQVTAILATGLPALLLFVALTSWWLVGRAIRPVERIRREVADITARDLSRRVPVPGADDEIAGLARTMNAMLERLERASERERGFVGDASHELRSPVAALRAQLEVAKADRTRAWVPADQEMLDETIRMENLIANLLLLAKSDGGADPATRPVIDLDDVVLAEVTRARETSAVPVELGAFEAARVRGDAHELGRVVRNLVENAQRHAATSVWVELRGPSAHDGGVQITVADDGPGVPADQRERVFDRFTRLDDARDRDHGGAGLGLAIARAVVRGADGDVHVEDRPGGGARFVVTLNSVAESATV